MTNESKLPLAGLRVIDASSIIAGPKLATYLGDFGAEVIKVEPPKGDALRYAGKIKDGKSLEWKLMSRNKKPITLNLGTEKGQELFYRLSKTADVVITNFRPNTLKKWNIDYENLSAVNEKLIMVKVSGFGESGPYSSRPGFGTLAEAMGGFANMNGLPDSGPLLPNFALADQVTALLGAFATMTAVYEREHSHDGKGQSIDLPIYEALIGILGNQVMEYDQLGVLPKRMGNRSEWSVPRNLYQTKDKKWVAVSGTAPSIVERIFKAIGREELIDDPKFKDNQARLQHADELEQIMADWMISHTQEEILERFMKYEATIAPVYNTAEMLQDPHFNFRENFIDVPDSDFGTVKMLNVIPKFSRTPGKIRNTGLEKGSCNVEVYQELGLSAEEMEEFKKNNII